MDDADHFLKKDFTPDNPRMLTTRSSRLPNLPPNNNTNDLYVKGLQEYLQQPISTYSRLLQFLRFYDPTLRPRVSKTASLPPPPKPAPLPPPPKPAPLPPPPKSSKSLVEKSKIKFDKPWISIVLILLTAIVLTVAILGIFSKPKPSPINLTPNSSDEKLDCTRAPFSCKTDSDCQTTCLDVGEELACTNVPTKTNRDAKLCIPKHATLKCNVDHGAIPIWTGFSGLGEMGWTCSCNESLYAGTPNCDKINANICMGSENPHDAFDWPKTNSPSSDDCKCPQSHVKVKRQSDSTPLCVLPNNKPWYSDTI